MQTPSQERWLAMIELLMLQLPPRAFNTTSWIIFDPHVKFVRGGILTTMENLVIQNVLRCEDDRDVHLHINENVLGEPNVGFREKVILKEVARNPGCTVRDCLQQCFAFLMDNKQHTNPAKYLLGKIIKLSKLQYWEWEEKNTWFTAKLGISIAVSTRLEMTKRLGDVMTHLQTQKDLHPELDQPFKRFSKEIRRQLYRWESRD